MDQLTFKQSETRLSLDFSLTSKQKGKTYLENLTAYSLVLEFFYDDFVFHDELFKDSLSLKDTY